MPNRRMLVLPAFVVLLAAQSVPAQDFSRYRNFQLGGSLESVAAASGAGPADTRLIHQRPALLQELRWRPAFASAQGTKADPVREIVFSFYNDELFLIVVEYDRYRIEGLTDEDFVEAISATYGLPVLAGRQVPGASPTLGPDAVIARWAGGGSSVTFLRGTYPTSARLVVASEPLEALALTAAKDAVRLDDREAPQRLLDQAKKKADDRRISDEKARIVNKAAFRP
ncbi:MAG: hypothetical protein KJ066_00200 [Acidobacteria bacterium]|nr:hypothetical protein [Acidobacteriota bacterium]